VEENGPSNIRKVSIAIDQRDFRKNNIVNMGEIRNKPGENERSHFLKRI
jgi:hypothetical protein